MPSDFFFIPEQNGPTCLDRPVVPCEGVLVVRKRFLGSRRGSHLQRGAYRYLRKTAVALRAGRRKVRGVDGWGVIAVNSAPSPYLPRSHWDPQTAPTDYWSWRRGPPGAGKGGYVCEAGAG